MSKLQLARQFVAYWSRTKRHSRLLAPLQLKQCDENGSLVFQWTVQESQLNQQDNIHLGYLTSVFDVTTNLGMKLGVAEEKLGVSIELKVSNLGAAKTGDVLTLRTENVKLGRTMAFASATLQNDRGDMIATAKHTAYLGGKGMTSDK